MKFAASFASFMVTLSGPEAFPFFSHPIASKTYFVLIVFKVILLLTETTYFKQSSSGFEMYSVNWAVDVQERPSRM